MEEKVATQPHWQEMYEEWQPQPQKKASKKEEPVEVETKYSESLDDLKETISIAGTRNVWVELT